MNTYNLQKLINSRDSLTLKNKKKLLKILKEYKNTNKTVIYENDIQSQNVIAKKFTTSADFDTYVAQHRGLEILPQEKQAVSNYDKADPTEVTDFYIKYENTDDFSNNNTTIIKKLKEQNMLCWTAFSKNQSASNISEAEEPTQPQQGQPLSSKPTAKPAPAQPEQQPEPQEDSQTLKDTIEIIKSLTFSDETTGSKILSDFLIKLDI